MKKRGNLLPDNVISLIITAGIVVVVVLAIIINFFNAGYNPNTEYSKTQMYLFEKAIEEAEEHGESTHTIIKTPSESIHFLVYFKDKPVVNGVEIIIAKGPDQAAIAGGHYTAKGSSTKLTTSFLATRNNAKNTICHCYFDYEKDKVENTNEYRSHCTSCVELEKPVTLNRKKGMLLIKNSDYLILENIQTYTITKKGDSYEIQ